MEYKNKHSKIVAIHQPNYLPWPGFFYKIYASDIFIFHDNVEHSKRYPTRRTRIRKAPHSEEPCWLTVPLKKHSDFSLIKDLEIDHSQDWQGKHLRKIKNSYAGTPYFGECFTKLEEWLAVTRQVDSLAEVNIFLIKKILVYLEINKMLWRSSELPVDGHSSFLNISLVKSLGGDVYLSGAGGKKYQNEPEFNKYGISLKYSAFRPDNLVSSKLNNSDADSLNLGYSILDLIFKFGRKGVIQLFLEASNRRT